MWGTGLWSKVVPYVGSRVPFGNCLISSLTPEAIKDRLPGQVVLLTDYFLTGQCLLNIGLIHCTNTFSWKHHLHFHHLQEYHFHFELQSQTTVRVSIKESPWWPDPCPVWVGYMFCSGYFIAFDCWYVEVNQTAWGFPTVRPHTWPVTILTGLWTKPVKHLESCLCLPRNDVSAPLVPLNHHCVWM
jgi:hypothetical protein